MITFKFPEEKIYLELFQSILQSTVIDELLAGKPVETSEQATELAEFFWSMVDKSIEFEKQDVLDQFPEGTEFWNEKLMYSLSGYLERAGFEAEWAAVVEIQ